MVPDTLSSLDIDTERWSDHATIHIAGDLDIGTAPRLIATVWR